MRIFLLINILFNIVFCQVTLQPSANVSVPMGQFCALTGQKIATSINEGDDPNGHCLNVILGDIPAQASMVSSAIASPENGAVLAVKKPFNVIVATNNLLVIPATFDSPVVPQSLDPSGLIKGHQKLVVQKLGTGIDPPNAGSFSFIGILSKSSVVSGSLSQSQITVNAIQEPGTYRICVMTETMSGHQPVIMPVAQRGSQDDCIRVKLV